MAMAVGNTSGSADVMVDINTTPLIDVMLVLLIMLIITIPVQTHAVKLDMPQGNNAPPPTDPIVDNVFIDFDGSITWNGNPVPDRKTLQEYLATDADKDPQPELHIRPDKLAKYQYVAEVMAEAQRLGMLKIGFVGMEQFADQ